MEKDPQFEPDADFASWAKCFHEHYEKGSRLEKEFHLTRKLVITARRWTSYIDGLIRHRTGFSRAQWHTLSALTFCDRPVPVVDLSRHMGVKWPTAIRVLKELESRGLIRSEADPADARARLIGITGEGRRVMDEVRAVLDPTRHEILAPLADAKLIEAERIMDELLGELARKEEDARLQR